MTPAERTEGQEDPQDKIQRPPIEIGITPFDNEQAVFRKSPDGGYTIFLRGEIRIAIHPEAAKSPVPAAEAPTSFDPRKPFSACHRATQRRRKAFLGEATRRSRRSSGR